MSGELVAGCRVVGQSGFDESFLLDESLEDGECVLVVEAGGFSDPTLDDLGARRRRHRAVGHRSAVLRNQPAIAGEVPSDPTVWRTFEAVGPHRTAWHPSRAGRGT